MINKTKLHDDLTMAFIRYQWRLEHPMPSPEETDDLMVRHYMRDSMFHGKVQSMSCHVMCIIESHLDNKGEG